MNRTKIIGINAVKEESQQNLEDAYLIYSFNGPKNVKVKTAAFADVPEDRVSNKILTNINKSDVGGDMTLVKENCLPDKKIDVNKSDCSHSIKNRNVSSSHTNSAFQNVPVYGEAFWVGEEDIPLELKPPSPRTARYEPINIPQNKALLASSSLLNITTNVRSINSALAVSMKPELSNNYHQRTIKNNQNPILSVSTNQRTGNVIKLVFPSPISSKSKNKTDHIDSTDTDQFIPGEASDEEEDENEENIHDYDVNQSMSDESRNATGENIQSHSTNGGVSMFSYRSGLANKSMRCPSCGRHYRNAYSLNHHICSPRKAVWRRGDVTCHIIDGQQIYFCPICGRPFKWLGNLTRHYYVHTGQRFFKCEICNKEFFSSYQVKRHMNSHTGLRYKCEICDKPFTCKYACAWHTRQHFVNTGGNAGGNSQVSPDHGNIPLINPDESSGNHLTADMLVWRSK